MRVRRDVMALLAAVGVLATACTASGHASGPAAKPGDMQLIAALTPFDACSDFLSWVKDAAKARVQPWGLSLGGYAGLGGVVPQGQPAATTTAGAGAMRAAAPPAPTPTGGTATNDVASSGAPSFSGTNVQEVGVDEPDVWKTDGHRIVTVQGTTLHIVDAANGGATELGRLDLPQGFYGGEVLLAGDRALVVSQQGGLYWSGSKVAAATNQGGPPNPAAVQLPSTRLLDIDLSNPTAPRIAADLQVEGGYVDARMVGTTVRLVLQSSPLKLGFVAPSSPTSTETARQANIAVIDQSTVEQWLPSYVLERDGKKTSGQLVDCARVHHPATFAGFSTLSVLTLDLSQPLTPGDAVAILGDGQRVYASTDNLYVALNRVDAQSDATGGTGASGDAPSTTVPPAVSDVTAIHKFSIAGSRPATYLASGQVRGHLMDELSMSEFQGNLRVATTDPGQPSVVPAVSGAPPASGGVARALPAQVAPNPAASESFVSVLAQHGKELVQVGQVGELGKGESIRAVRFDGPVGYVVTFRQIDPLYTVDLSDPAHPRTRGELALLGFSAYLHPLGGGRLLGIGQDATEQGRITGAQVSLFDVTDLDHPRLLNRVALPSGWSNVGHDYHAFLWWAAAKLAAVPMLLPQASPGDQGFSGLIGFTVDGDALGERGRISHATGPTGACQGPVPVPMPAPVPGPGPVPPATAQDAAAGSASSSTGVASPGATIASPAAAPSAVPVTRCLPPYVAISRSLVIGDALYTLSAAGVKSSAVSDLADRAWLAFA